jgi:hypothetical protein
MKKNAFIILLILSSIDLFAQFNKGNVIVNFDGNYQKTNNESGVSTNQTSIKGQYLSLSPSIGYCFSNQWLIGFGIDYNLSKEDRINGIFFNLAIQQTETNIKSKVFMPNINLSYNCQIINNLYLSAVLKLGIGTINTETKTVYAYRSSFIGNAIPQTDTVSLSNINNYNSGFNSTHQFDYFNSSLSPEIIYFIKPKFGIYLGLGGLEYSMIDWKNDNSNFAVNFNPNFWRIGIKVRL